MPQTGNLAVLLRAPGCEGWVPGAGEDERMRIDWPPKNRPGPIKERLSTIHFQVLLVCMLVSGRLNSEVDFFH